MDRNILKTVILDQQSLSFRKGEHIERLDLLGESGNEIVVISGVRRCGKSTLMHEIRFKSPESDFYLNFDDERLIHFSVDDFQLLHEIFIELFGLQKTFFFDEIQNIKGWERFVRRLHDAGNKIYITGSNASMLSRELGTHLTGRYLQFELYPFSFREYIYYKPGITSPFDMQSTAGKAELKKWFNMYFQLGGFPAFLQSENRLYLKSLFESILYRDIIVRNGLTSEREMLELVYYLSSNVAKPASYNSLKNVINVKNPTTVKNYLEFIQYTYLLFQVNKYDASLKTQLHNPRKIYFIDVALIRELGFHTSEDNGRILENLVFLEFKRRGKTLFYHREKHECDFVLKEKNRITHAIQVTWSMYNEDTRKREINGLLEAIEMYGLSEGLILTESEEDEISVNNSRVQVKPVWKWLLEN